MTTPGFLPTVAEAAAVLLAVAAYTEALDRPSGTREIPVEMQRLADSLARVLAVTSQHDDDLVDEVACDRCGKVYDESQGDGYCGLCPACADDEE